MIKYKKKKTKLKKHKKILVMTEHLVRTAVIPLRPKTAGETSNRVISDGRRYVWKVPLNYSDNEESDGQITRGRVGDGGVLLF